MNTKLTILTSIVLTAASTAAGTYYLTASVQSGNTPETTVTTQPNADNPVQVEVNQDSDKPVTIIVKAEATEKPHKPRNIGHIRDLKQPHLEIMQNPKTP